MNIIDKVYNFLEDVSDDVGESELSKNYILMYEGWSHGCFEDIYDDSLDEEENDANFYQYAEEQSPIIIKNDWIPKKIKENMSYVDGGYYGGGLYGVTWALFKKNKKK